MVVPWLLKVHRYLAFAGATLFLLLGLTGSALVFRPELERTLYPERQLAVAPADGVRYQRLLDVARERAPHAVAWRINPPADPSRAVQVVAEGPDEMFMYLHPSTGQVISVGALRDFLLDWLLELHIALLGAPGGQVLVFLTGCTLAIMALSGLILWWPRNLKAAFRLRLSARGLPFQYDLHRLAGLLSAPLLLALAISGTLLLYPEKSMSVVRWLSGSEDRAPVVPPGAFPMQLDLDRVVAEANKALPQGRVTRVTVPANGAAIVVRKKTEDEPHPNGLSLVIVDPRSERVLSAVGAANASTSIRMWGWIYPLHIGTLFGRLHRVVVLAAGLLPALLGFTGIMVWWYRRRRS